MATDHDAELDELRHMAALLAKPIARVTVELDGATYVLDADDCVLSWEAYTLETTTRDDKARQWESRGTYRADLVAHGYALTRVPD